MFRERSHCDEKSTQCKLKSKLPTRHNERKPECSNLDSACQTKTKTGTALKKNMALKLLSYLLGDEMLGNTASSLLQGTSVSPHAWA